MLHAPPQAVWKMTKTSFYTVLLVATFFISYGCYHEFVGRPDPVSKGLLWGGVIVAVADLIVFLLSKAIFDALRARPK